MKNKFKRLLKKAGTAIAASAIAIMSVLGVSAASDTNSEAVSAVEAALASVTGTITISSVLQIIAIGLGASVGFFFMWFGIRWVIRKVTKAFKSGRLG